jgi:hypothetical protein
MRFRNTWLAVRNPSSVVADEYSICQPPLAFAPV